MTDDQYAVLKWELYGRQDGLCATCGKPLAYAGTLELAHRVPRGELVRKLGKAAEWHLLALALVCTRKGKNCNDGALAPIGLPRQAIMERIREDIA